MTNAIGIVINAIDFMAIAVASVAVAIGIKESV